MASKVAGDRASTSGEDGSSGSGGELAREQQVVDVVYARLDELRELYRERLSDVRAGGSVGTHQMRSERDAFAQHYTETLARMDQVEDRLVFGRLDLVDGPPRYVGRIGIQDAGRSQLLLDWRAPSARPFYQATAVNPDGAVRRRHLQTRRRTVVGLEDELLDADNLTDDLRLELRGEGALFAAMNEARTEHMTDIVATIQAEQDAVVRSDLDGVLVVQGGPGTGKTAVALHRIAYLLHAHRERLARSGVLLVGPSPVFLAYVDQVLPSLGETDVIATTLADLVPGVRARGDEDTEVAEIKGRGLMASAMRRLVRAHQRVPDSPRRLEVEGAVLTLRPGDVRHALSRARRAYPTHNQGWETFVRTLVPILTDQYAAARGVSDPAERPDLMEDVRSSREVRVAINLCWMPRTPTELLERFYARPDLLAACAPELTPRERELLRRSPRSDLTEADVPLIDELAELLGPHEGAEQRAARAAGEAERARDVQRAREAIEAQDLGGGMVDAETLAGRFAASGPSLTTAERAAADRSWTYGHVVVDEAQELSPMAWRMLARRVPVRSMTVVGDLDQRRGTMRATSWAELLGPAAGRELRESVLTVSYRTPATILDAATRALAATGRPPTHPVTAARDIPGSLTTARVPTGELASAAADAAADALAELDARSDGAGRVAIVAGAARLGLIADAARRGARTAPALEPTGSGRLVVTDAAGAKGLEYDVVVLVEPAELAAGGAGDLYVAMTRPTRHLTIVHHADLPGGIEED
ncbi:Superfamily I DNA and RNA helicases [Actinomycetales bacterium JB111]|nr:Superfamily I DNA and RNA helicases [Actinomycetales bacterium JB111]